MNLRYRLATFPASDRIGLLYCDAAETVRVRLLPGIGGSELLRARVHVCYNNLRTLLSIALLALRNRCKLKRQLWQMLTVQGTQGHAHYFAERQIYCSFLLSRLPLLLLNVLRELRLRELLPTIV